MFLRRGLTLVEAFIAGILRFIAHRGGLMPFAAFAPVRRIYSPFIKSG